jgi:hypothetical protein
MSERNRTAPVLWSAGNAALAICDVQFTQMRRLRMFDAASELVFDAFRI